MQDRQFFTSNERLGQIYDYAYRRAENGFRMGELSNYLGLSRTRCYALLSTMIASGVIVKCQVHGDGVGGLGMVLFFHADYFCSRFGIDLLIPGHIYNLRQLTFWNIEEVK